MKTGLLVFRYSRFVKCALLALVLFLLGASSDAIAATYSVTNTNSSGSGSLAQAVADANSNSGADVINFNIGGTGPFVISMSSGLSITDEVTIDGTSQSGYSSSPVIHIKITGILQDAIYVSSGGAGSVFKALSLTGTNNAGFLIGADSVTVSGCYVGIEPDGTTTSGGSYGIFINGKGTLIGGSSTSDRNVISGNVTGIYINADGAEVYNNYIGCNAAGTAAKANTKGIEVYSSNAIIGASGKGNLITGNSGNAIEVASTATGTTVIRANYIGVNAAGTAKIGNSRGVYVDATGVTIGGSSSGEGNVISGNNDAGIYVNDGGDGTVIKGNYVGVNAAGSAAIANSNTGLWLRSDNNIVGGSTANERNVVSGNVNDGVYFEAGSGNTFKGNYVGISADGTTAIGNGFGGILINNGSSNHIIGGAASGEGNVISGSTTYSGIESFSGSTGNIIKGNKIGTNAAGTAALPNNDHGLNLPGKNNVIGGGGSGEGNLVSGNKNNGILVSGDSTIVEGNIVGLGSDGSTIIANGIHGIRVTSKGSTIGGSGSGEGNIVSGNTQHGISLEGADNIVKGNWIGLDNTGAVLKANGQHGINISATGNAIGGSASGDRNTIVAGAGATYDAVRILSTATGTTLKGNYIGLNGAGTARLGEGWASVRVEANNIIVGGSGAGEGNAISGGSQYKIYIPASLSGIKVHGNIIGTNAAGTAGLGGGYAGIYVNSPSIEIGGSNAGEGNVISGGLIRGIYADSDADGIIIKGNKIGTDINGTADLGSNSGIWLHCDNAVIGGSTANERNIISGNGVGIEIEAGTGDVIKGNYVGTTADGNSALGNSATSIICKTGTHTIGGSAAGEGNVISGNNVGIGISGASTGNSIYGNYIGTNAAGTTALGNNGYGIYVQTPSNKIGGSNAGEGNVISGNGGEGIYANGSADGLIIKGNIIGLNAAGTAKVGNGNEGIELVTGCDNVVIGGATTNERNIVSGNNGAYGILANGNGLTLENNYLGTDITGATGLGNTGDGILIDGSSATVKNNVASGNTAIGIHFGTSGTGATVTGNKTGTNAAGTAAIANGNSGIWDDGGNNTIGGNSAADGNLASGNTNYGIVINSAASSASTLKFNKAGTNAAGTSGIANGKSGIYLAEDGNAVTNNTVGFNGESGILISSLTNTIQSNTIFNNTRHGVTVSNAGSRNLISQNSIYGNGNLGIDLGDNGVTANDANDTDNGANELQNYPVITKVTYGGGNTTVEGELNSTASSSFTIEFYGNSTADPSGYGEGETYITNMVVATNGSGDATFTKVLTGTINNVTLLAIDAANNTSEFSAVPVTEIAVEDNSFNNIADGSSFAFGTTYKGSPLTKTFKIKNTGALTLNVSSLSLPTGFSLSGVFPSSINGGDSATFDVKLDATTVGSYSGTLSFTTDDADENPFNFTISGTVDPAAEITAGGPTTFCAGGSVTLHATTGGNSYSWLKNGSTTGQTADSLVAADSASYRVIINFGSFTDTSDAVMVTVNPLPNTPTVTDGKGCANSPITLKAVSTSAGSTTNWFKTATGGTSFASGDSIVVNLSADSTFYAQSKFSGDSSLFINKGASFYWTQGFMFDVRTLQSTNIRGLASLLYTPFSPFNDTVQVYYREGSKSTATGKSDWTLIYDGINTFKGGITASDTESYVFNTPLSLQANKTYSFYIYGPTPSSGGGPVSSGSTTDSVVSSSLIVYPGVGASSAGSFTPGTGNYLIAPAYILFDNAGCESARVPVKADVDAVTATITAMSDTIFCDGGSVLLQSSTGTGYTYQWQKDNVDINGATDSTYTASVSGMYTVVITKGFCTKESQQKQVFVKPVPVATITPSTQQDIIPGDSVALTASTGTGYTYQWLLDDVIIPAATGSSYHAKLQGNYTVIIAKDGCPDTSAATYVYWLKGEIELSYNGTNITDGSTTPVYRDSTIIGNPITRTIKIKNTGPGPLNLSSLQLPAGFSLSGGFPSSIAAGDSSTFDIKLDAVANGTYTDSVSFTTDDDDENPFSFYISGFVGCWNKIYVDGSTGDDNNIGSTAAAPKKTIQAAVNYTCDGGTIAIVPGTYNESVDSKDKTLTFEKNGTGSIDIKDLEINGSSDTIFLTDPLIVTGTLKLTNGILKTTGSTYVEIGCTTGAISGGSASSYIDGEFRFCKTGTGNFTQNLPIGKDGIYKPLVLDVSITTANPTDENKFSSEMFNVDPATLSLTVPQGLRLIDERYYQVDRYVSNGTVTSAQLTIPFGSGAASEGIDDLNNVYVLKGNGSGAWLNLGGNATGTLNGLLYDGSIESNAFTSFSPFTLATGCGANPKPDVDFSFSNACVGTAVTVTNNTTIAAGSIDSYIIDWGDGSAQVVQNAGGYPPNPVIPNHTYTTAGTYPVSIQAESDMGCLVSLTKYITISPIPAATITLPSTDVCEGSGADFIVNVSNVATTEDWSIDYTTTNPANNVTITGTGSGNFQFTSPALTGPASTIDLVSISNTSVTPNCVNTTLGQVNVTINPATVGGTVSSNATVCSGSNSGTLTLAGHTGTVQKWQYSTDGGTNWFDVANTSTSYNYTNLTTSTMYRAVVKSGVCAEANSAAATITVNPLPTASINSGTTICAGNTATLTVTVANTGGANWSIGYQEGGSTTTLTGTGDGNFNLVTGILTAATDVTLQSIALTSGSPLCTNTLNSKAVVTVDPLPNVTISGSTTICTGTTADLTVTVSNVKTTDNWSIAYNDGTNNYNLTGTGTGNFILTTPVLTATTTFTVTGITNTSTTCASTITGQAATVTVSPATVGGTVSSNATVCSGSNSGTLTLAGHTGTVQKWQYSTDGGTNWFDIANTSTSYNYTNLTTSTMYRAVVKSGACAEANSAAATITVNPLPTASINSGTTICAGNTATLTVTVANTGGANWSIGYQEGGSTTTLTGTGDGNFNLVTGTLTAATDVTLQSITLTSGAPLCTNTLNSKAKVTVDPLPNVTISGSTTICTGTTADLTVTVSNVKTTDNWSIAYNDGTNNYNLTGTGTGNFILTTPVLTATTTFTVTGITNTSTTCASTITGQAATVTVSPATVGGTVSSNATVCSGSNSGTLTLAGQTGTVQKWQYSTDGGTNWFDIANTSTSYNYTNLTTSTMYRAVVKSGACGEANSAAATITVQPLPTASINAGTSICSGTTATLTVTVSNSNGQAWSISYQEGASNKALTGTGDGNFNLVTANLTNNTDVTLKGITLTSGSPLCTNTLNSKAKVTVNPVPTATISGSQTICTGNAPVVNVTVSNVPSGEGWTLNYMEGATAKSLTGTGSGSFVMNTSVLTNPPATVTYTLTDITNTGSTPNCTNSSLSGNHVVTISPSTVGGTLSPATAAHCGTTNNGTITLSGHTGSVVRWEYSTDGGSTWTNIANATASQNYTNLTVTTRYRALVQSSPCASAYSAAAVITVNPQPMAVISGNQTICSGDVPVIDVTVTNVPGGQNWSLNYTEGSTNKTLTGTGSGSFVLNASALNYPPATVTYTLTSITNTSTTPNCGNTGLGSQHVVTVSPTTVGGLLSTTSAAVCYGTNSGTLTLVGNTGSILRWEYSEDGGNSWVNISNTTTTQNFQNLTKTTRYRVLVKSGVCPQQYSSEQVITVNPLPVATISGDDELCTGGSSAITFTVSSVDAADNWTINYTENGAAKTFSGTGAGNFNLPTGTLNYPPAKVEYVLQSIDNTTTGCSNSASGKATVKVNPAPVAAFTMQNVCEGSSVNFQNSSTVAEGNIVKQRWSFGDGKTSSSLNPAHTYAAAGTYDVKLVVETASGCKDSITKKVTVHPAPKASFSVSNACLNDSVVFVNASTVGSGNIVTYIWSFGDGDSSTLISPKHKYFSTGTFNVTLTVTTDSGCTSSMSKFVTLHPLPVANYTTSPVCEDDSMYFFNTSSTVYGAMTYLWDFGTGDSSTKANPAYLFSGSGTFDVKLITTSEFGCSDTIVKQVTVHPKPQPEFDQQDVCIGQEMTFTDKTILASGNLRDIEWDFGDTTSAFGKVVRHTYRYPGTYNVTLTTRSDKGCVNVIQKAVIVYDLPDATITPSGAIEFCDGGSVDLSAPSGMTSYLWSNNSTSRIITVNKSGVYKVLVVNANGCINEDSIVVTVWPLPVANAGRDTTISKGYTVQMRATGGENYVWTPSTGLDNPNIANPGATPMETTTYIVTVTDSNGCSSSDSVTIFVIDDIKLEVTNTITPNGDGKNDVWYIGNIVTYPSCEVIIFNRYGQEIYRKTGYNNDWDGTYNGAELPDGTYYYIIECEGDKVYKGAVNIIRSNR